VDASGVRAALTGDQLEVIASPTHGADTYEVRISRHPDRDAAPALAQVLQGRGRARTMYVLSDASGQNVGWSDPEIFTMPAASDGPPLADVTVPAKAPGTLRVMSYNVHRDELMKNPSPFARAIQVTQPDIILLQEWGADEPTAAAWFTAVVSGVRCAWWGRSSGRRWDPLPRRVCTSSAAGRPGRLRTSGGSPKRGRSTSSLHQSSSGRACGWW
jgi:hypothetical protein